MRRYPVGSIGALLLVGLGCGGLLVAGEPTRWPDAELVWRVLSLRDYNTRIVVAGVGLVGLGAGVIGSLLFLQKRALLGDALAHATLPGIGLAFLALTAAGSPGKWLPALLLGASVCGLLGVVLVQAISRTTRLGQDAALGIVLSVFFGFGIAVMGVINGLPGVDAAGLNGFIEGRPASLTRADLWACTLVTALVLALVVGLRKEWRLLLFDPATAATQGWPVRRLDLLLLVLVTLVVVVGLQAVGVILILAMLIIPAAAARFWTDAFGPLVALAGLFGAIAGVVGALLSALVADLPAGGIIVLVAAAVFLVSMAVGRRHGFWWSWLRRRELQRLVDRQILLRAAWEHGEETAAGDFAMVDLPALASWTPVRLRRALGEAQRRGWIRATAGRFHLTPAGRGTALAVVRNHRLWCMFLRRHAESAPDRLAADLPDLGSMLPAEEIGELESAWRRVHPDRPVPALEPG